MEEYLEIGKIINTHGVRGELKVLPLTDDPARYDDLAWAYVEKDGNLRKYKVNGVKYFKNFVIVKFDGIYDMNTAESLKECFIKIDRKNAIKLPKDSFFIFDLIGCDVLEENGNRLGVFDNVIKTGSNDVFVIKADDGKEILIPALKSVVKEVSLEKKRITVLLPEGLI